MEIQTKRLRLRPLGSEYLESVYEYAADLENTRYMINLPNGSKDETADFLKRVDQEWKKEKPEFYEFAILYGNRHIGAACVYFEEDVGELGWIINKKYWGQGFAGEAAEALVRYCSDHMGTTRFIAHCDTENVASYKVMEKLGMKKTGEWGGRRNKASSKDSFEYQYELKL